MSKKKILIVICIILLVAIVIFLIHSARNFIIISKLQDKALECINSNNYHTRTITHISDESTVTTDYYKKENKQAVFIQKNENGNVIKLLNYNNGERTDFFTETQTEKTVKLDTKSSISAGMFNILQTDNNWQTFLYSSISIVRSTKYNEKECYIIDNYLSPYYLNDYDTTTAKYIIDKQTGLILKDESSTIVEYEYEFDNVDDSIFIEPDISQYKIQENN